jgi:hypothetical protein
VVVVVALVALEPMLGLMIQAQQVQVAQGYRLTFLDLQNIMQVGAEVESITTQAISQVLAAWVVAALVVKLRLAELEQQIQVVAAAVAHIRLDS